MHESTGRQSSPAFSFDAIVVGSGFGGGTVALRLAQAGKRVLVLERGRRWRGQNLAPLPQDRDATPFPQLGDLHFFWGRQIWRPFRQRLGLVEMKQFSNLQGLVSAGVGGGSLIWANVVIEAPDFVFEKGWPAGITRESLEPYYRRAERYLRPAIVPGVPGHYAPDGRTVKRAALLKKAASQVGASWKPVRVAVNFADEEKAAPNGFGRARQLGCNYCGLCSAGCPQNAKNTVDVSYIAAAEALGAEIRTLHTVTGIEPLSGGGYRVHFERYQIDGKRVESNSVSAPIVVLCAGTFGTTELLLRAKNRGTLPLLSEALGSRFSTNGNVLSGALRKESTLEQIELLDANSGPAIASMVDYGKFAVEDFANPNWTNGVVGGSSLRRIVAFAKALLGLKPSAAELRRQAKDLLVYVGVGFDGSRGRLKLNVLGQLVVEWPGGINNEPVVKELHQAMAQLAAVQGRQYVPNVFSIFNRPLTYHPLGGCPMGDDPSIGVADPYGAVWGYDGLYIADGSLVPTAIGRNPAFTIAALSERVAERILQQ